MSWYWRLRLWLHDRCQPPDDRSIAEVMRDVNEFVVWDFERGRRGA